MKKYRTTKKYQNGGKTTPTKPGTKPAAKGTVKKKTSPYATEGERLGSALKRGDYMGAVKEAGQSLAGIPKEFVGALKRSLR